MLFSTTGDSRPRWTEEANTPIYLGEINVRSAYEGFPDGPSDILKLFDGRERGSRNPARCALGIEGDVPATYSELTGAKMA